MCIADEKSFVRGRFNAVWAGHAGNGLQAGRPNDARRGGKLRRQVRNDDRGGRGRAVIRRSVARLVYLKTPQNVANLSGNSCKRFSRRRHRVTVSSSIFRTHGPYQEPDYGPGVQPHGLPDQLSAGKNNRRRYRSTTRTRTSRLKRERPSWSASR